MSAGRRVLAVIETQRVKDYLFASPILRETRGASLLLDRLNRRLTREIARRTGGEVVYLGGGSGRVLFTGTEPAERFARAVRSLYRSRAWDAHVSVEVLGRQARESFPAWVARGVARSRESKLARIEAVPILGGRWIRPCSSCGREAAEEIPPPDVQGRHRLCPSCLRKRAEVRRFYREAKRNFDLRVPVPTAAEQRARGWDFVLTTLAEAVERPDGARTLLPRDFEQIGQRSRPAGYMALIYADGNRMGETLQAMAGSFAGEDAREAYRAFSEIVDQATRRAAVDAVLAAVGTEEAETHSGEPARLVPAELIVAGGDDLILAVPAHAGLATAERFLSLFRRYTEELQAERVAQGRLARPFAPGGLTSSAGVVLAHASYPASQLVELAIRLMKLAKHKASDLALAREREAGDGEGSAETDEGTLDFMVLHEPGSEDLKHRRREYEGTLAATGGKVRRTERPYTAAGVRALCDTIRALKDSEVPRSKLKALYAALFRSRAEAQYEALRIKERLGATGDLVPGSPLHKLVADLPLFPFREDSQGDWSTPLSELIEVYDFVGRETVDA